MLPHNFSRLEIHLVRHTQVNLSAGICYGQTDVELSIEGKENVSKLPLDLDYTRVFSSPLQRCLAITTYFSFPVIVEERLKEMNFGRWELQKWSEIPKVEIDPWYNDFVNQSAPGGETLQEMANRILQFWTSINPRENEKILIVTHAGVIRVLLAHWHNTPLNKMFDYSVDYGAVFRLSFKSGRLINRLM